jgi:hypothetical protein
MEREVLEVRGALVQHLELFKEIRDGYIDLEGVVAQHFASRAEMLASLLQLTGDVSSSTEAVESDDES